MESGLACPLSRLTPSSAYHKDLLEIDISPKDQRVGDVKFNFRAACIALADAQECPVHVYVCMEFYFMHLFALDVSVVLLLL